MQVTAEQTIRDTRELPEKMAHDGDYTFLRFLMQYYIKDYTKILGVQKYFLILGIVVVGTVTLGWQLAAVTRSALPTHERAAVVPNRREQAFMRCGFGGFVPPDIDIECLNDREDEGRDSGVVTGDEGDIMRHVVLLRGRR